MKISLGLRSVTLLLLTGGLYAVHGFSFPSSQGLVGPAAKNQQRRMRCVWSMNVGSTHDNHDDGGDTTPMQIPSLRFGLSVATLTVLLAGSPSWAQISLPGLWQSGGSPSDGYELAPVQKDGKPSPVLLVPVIEAVNDLKHVADLIRSDKTESWQEAYKLLSAKPFNPPIELKRILNAYTDNIYFSDAGRKNMYLDGSAMLGMGKSTFGFGTVSVGNGGASPETKDTMTYLYQPARTVHLVRYRNEALNNVDALTAEVKYLIAQREKGVDESQQDLLKYLKDAQAGLDNYLSTIPNGELKAAQEYVQMKTAK